MGKMSVIEVGDWLEQLHMLSSGQAAHCPSFLKPIHLVTMGLAAKKCGGQGLRLPQHLEKYASRMHLWESVGMTAPCSVTHLPPDGRFLPVHRFDLSTRDVLSVINQLASIINRTLSEEYRASLSVCIEELVNNFFDHADSAHTLPCLTAAQCWPNSGRLVQVAIADAGVGVRCSLGENTALIKRLAEGNACELASTYGISCKPHNGHSGYGLALAEGLMKQANGTYILVSGNEIYAVSGKKITASQLQYAWDGTILVLEWSLDTELDSLSVYNSWPSPE